MTLLIKRTSDFNLNPEFIDFLVSYIRIESLKAIKNHKYQLNQMSEEYKIDVVTALAWVLKNGLITHKTDSTCEIAFSNTLKYDSYTCDQLINLVTYGTRTTKGWVYILNIFKLISNDINVLYNRWLKET